MATAARTSPAATTIELARFATRPAAEGEFLEKREAAIRAIRAAYPGLVSVALVRLESTPDRTVWLDVALWDSRAQAEAAAANCHLIPEFAAWTSHIAEEIGMEHGEVVDTI